MDDPSVTQWLHRARDGEAEALGRAYAAAYEDLKQTAHAQLRRGGGGLEEVFSDRLFADLGISRHEIVEMAELLVKRAKVERAFGARSDHRVRAIEDFQQLRLRSENGHSLPNDRVLLRA